MKLQPNRRRLIGWILAGLLLLSSCRTDGATASSGQTTIAGRDPDPAEETDKEAETAENERPDLSALDDLSLDPAVGQLAYILALPEDSAQPSGILARQALLLCSGHTEENTAELLGQAGFELLTQRNFDKDPAAPDHTCAYTVARKQVLYGNEPRTLLLAAIRGTNGGEWYSNFDPAPSESESPVFAENFLFAAEDVLLTLNEYASAEECPLLLLCGHSRGAACANLLGLLANDLYGMENVFVYTFATPATLCGDAPDLPDGNIFNYLNPRDLVPMLPPSEWNCRRAGTDFLLPDVSDGENGSDEEAENGGKHYADVMDALCGISPTMTAYYGERHSLQEAGLSEDGLTAYEVFLLIGKALAGSGDLSGDGDSETDPADGETDLGDLISEESDFYPLIELFGDASDDGWKAGIEVLLQHLPTTYAELLELYTASEEGNGYGIH